MKVSYLNRFILSLVLASTIAGCATPKTADRPVAGAVKPAQSADVFAADALGTYQLQRDGARALTLIAAAVQRAPDRADIAYVQVALCRLTAGCAAEPFEARLRKLDPGNAVVWLRALSSAQRQRDENVEAQVLEAMSRSERFDVYWNSLASSIATARAPAMKDIDRTLSDTIGWLGGTIVPSMQPITTACTRMRTADATWAERCRRVSQVLMKGDTYLAESVGLAIARQVTADPIELVKLGDRARSSRYLWRMSAEMVSSQVERDRFAIEHLKLMSKLRREQDVHLAITRWSGHPLTPPLDFRMDE